MGKITYGPRLYILWRGPPNEGDMDENEPDYWMKPYETWRNITNDALRDLRPRNLPPVSAFIPGNPYKSKREAKPIIVEIA